MARTNIVYNSAHPDIPLPSPALVEIGTAFTAAIPQTVSGWTFEGWYTDRNYTNKWVDGTVITGDLDLFGKWTEGGGGGDDAINFAYTNNSEDKSAPLPNSIIWPENTRIYPNELPNLPTPSASTTTITGWYLDPQGLSLVDDSGVLVGEGGITLYAKALSSTIYSVSFDYALGKVDTETDENYPMPETATAAWDAETLGDDSTLPKEIIVGERGETVELPLAEDMQALFADTDCEAEFKGWYTEPIAEGEPVTEVTIGDDTTVYALYEPKKEPEFIDVTYKIANVYAPKLTPEGEIVPSDEKISVEDAISLMPDIPCEYVGAENATSDEVELTDYEWHDKVLKGSKYRLALPDNTTERTSDYQFGGYYSDINCETELGTVIEELNENMTVYCKFVPKSEVVLDSEELPDTYNISFEVDGFAADTDVPSGGLMPPDLELPDATAHQPVEIDKEAFPDLIDAYVPEEMPASEGFKFVRWYFYDAEGNKVNFVPNETEITRDMVLHPEFEILSDLETQTTVKLVELTPDVIGAPVELDWNEVPSMPFEGITNPITVTVGTTFDVSSITLPHLEDTFEIEGYYTLDTSTETPALVKFTSGIINDATTLYVRFTSTIAEPIDVVYNYDESLPEVEQLLAPDFDYELAAATATTGGLDYEPRPADLVAVANSGLNDTSVVISGYYSDEQKTTLFNPSTATIAGEQINIYPKFEQQNKIMVTVDYIPKVYSLTGSNFQFEIPTAPELPLSPLTATTYLFDPNTTGANILATVAIPPIIQFWKPKNHEYGNCYWYTVASDASQIPQPFNPEGFSLTEPITLYPQFEADMTFPVGLIRRGDIKLSLTGAVSQSAAAGAPTSTN